MASLRLLGRSGVRVSKLCLGTWMFGTRTDEAESRRILNAALDAGINFVDTANRYGRDVVNPTVDYGGGLSEEYIGRALKDRGASVRQEIVLATKVFGAVGPGSNERGLSRVHIVHALEDSLRRLQTDYVDLYYIHWPDPDTPLDTTARAMDDLVHSGKVRYWATSNHPAWKVTRVHWLCERYGLEPPVAEQSPYSLLNRGLERELLPCARELGFAVNPYSPLAGGLLTGKYHVETGVPDELEGAERLSSSGRRYAPPPADSRASWNRGTARRAEEPRTAEIVRAATEIAAALGRPLSQVALNWVAAQPGITCPIIGPRTLDQFLDNAGALEWELPADVVERLSALAA